MKKQLIISYAALLLVACGSGKESESGSQETSSMSSNADDWKDYTAENVTGKWKVIGFDSEMKKPEVLMGKTFEFGTDTIDFSWFNLDGEVEQMRCFYEVGDREIDVTIEDDNGSRTVDFTGGIDKGILLLNNKRGYVKLEKIN